MGNSRKERHWLAAACALLAPGLFLAVLGWTGYQHRRTWLDWLENLQPADAAPAGRDGRFGRQATGLPGVDYLGDGRVSLGDFSIRTFDPLTKRTLRSEFRLEAQTPLTDEAAFLQAMQGNLRLMREQVMVAVRTSSLDELTDPTLTVLEKKIVSRINRVLGRRLLDSARIRDFDLSESVEQSSYDTVMSFRDAEL
jgi:hypothetical protein